MGRQQRIKEPVNEDVIALGRLLRDDKRLPKRCIDLVTDFLNEIRMSNQHGSNSRYYAENALAAFEYLPDGFLED